MVVLVHARLRPAINALVEIVQPKINAMKFVEMVKIWEKFSVMMAIPKTMMVATLSARERFSGYALEDLPLLQTNASSQ
jgi:hypothetical protein